MSDPALKMQTPAAARPPSGPLQDWLATLSRIDAADQARAAPRRTPEAPPSWEPRIVVPNEPAAPEAPPSAPEAGAEQDDLAALLAENMMLKARLRQEHGRYDELQAMLADELRALRAHMQQEVDRAEELRAERDLWMARAEALAQPLFQPRR